MKGVVIHGGKVVLLKNERDEWELPGGKLELGERPEDCVVREIEEELGLLVKIGPLLDTWVYHIREGIDVFMVTYGCTPEPYSEITHSPEHKGLGRVSIEEIDGLNMPENYKKSVHAWYKLLGR
jgi:mutator protein MutT